MIPAATVSSNAFDVVSLMEVALGPPSPQNLSAVLRYLSRALRAHGCVIWEKAPDPPPTNAMEDGRLFVLASHFPTQIRCAKHDLPITESITGRVVLGEPYVIENNVRSRSHIEGDCAFLDGCSAMISVSLALRENSRGALNVYRTDGIPFTSEDVCVLLEVCRLLPALYQAAHDRVGFNLSKAVDKALRDDEVAACGQTLTFDEKKAVLNKVCSTMAEALCCHEVSLFLFDCKEISLYLQGKSPETLTFKLIASTIEPLLSRKLYLANESNGLTGWVLHNRKPVWIFDLANYERDRIWINRLYPNLSWSDLGNVERITRELFDLSSNDPLPPLCVMALPIQIGEKVIGVIRCSIGKGPYYFSSRDQYLVALVAAQIGQCWNTWLNRRELETENKSWTNLIESIKGINTLVQHEIEKNEPDETLIFREFLDAINIVIPPANLTSVRLIDSNSSELYYKLIRGSAWDESQWDVVKNHRAPLRVAQTESAAVKLINEDLPIILIPDTSKTPFAQKLFPEIKRKIVVPIKDALRTIGVLDIRSTLNEPFSKHAQAVAQLLGLQLGIYRRLVDTISSLKKEHRQQSQTWADISHQLKGPIYQAKRRADTITDRFDRLGNEPLYRACRAVRGLCRKSQRVVQSLNLIARLARDEQIKPDLTALDYPTLMKMLISASQDAELMIDPSRAIVFRVDRESFADLTRIQVFVDHDLLEQAVNNIFDNAGKYSFKNSTVQISGMFSVGSFAICVRSCGLTIRPEELEKCVQREWRGEKAKLSTQEGSGIGLWIVDHIMKSHGGRLVIEPTNPNYLTNVNLIFPTKREIRR